MTGLYLLLAGGIIMTGGDIMMKFWVKEKTPSLFFIGLFIYLVALTFLAYSYKFRNIAVGSAIIVIVNIVALSLVSWFYFHEKLSSLQIFGLVLAIISVIILELGRV